MQTLPNRRELIVKVCKILVGIRRWEPEGSLASWELDLRPANRLEVKAALSSPGTPNSQAKDASA